MLNTRPSEARKLGPALSASADPRQLTSKDASADAFFSASICQFETGLSVQAASAGSSCVSASLHPPAISTFHDSSGFSDMAVISVVVHTCTTLYAITFLLLPSLVISDRWDFKAAILHRFRKCPLWRVDLAAFLTSCCPYSDMKGPWKSVLSVPRAVGSWHLKF